MQDTQKHLIHTEDIFNINSESKFQEISLAVFRHQYHNNIVYRQWTDLLKINVEQVKLLQQIPFLPIEFFKRMEIVSSPVTENTIVFTSSSTTSQTPSKHFVNKVSLYETSFLRAFELFYGKPQEVCILALLPNYLQRKGSSLVYMFNELLKRSQHPLGGFFLDNIEDLKTNIEKLKKNGQKTILLGVSYALMDLADSGLKLTNNFIVMETGGMKGQRKELLKHELHAYLKNGFGIDKVHSEYGMTELLSQAYSQGDEKFSSPPWMKFLIRDVTDPLSYMKAGKTGGINVIDLANLHSCSFIATSDLGKTDENGRLELMGRFDNSDVRGCNLMLS